jgi:hypothetical protein
MTVIDEVPAAGFGFILKLMRANLRVSDPRLKRMTSQRGYLSQSRCLEVLPIIIWSHKRRSIDAAARQQARDHPEQYDGVLLDFDGVSTGPAAEKLASRSFTMVCAPRASDTARTLASDI